MHPPAGSDLTRRTTSADRGKKTRDFPYLIISHHPDCQKTLRGHKGRVSVSNGHLEDKLDRLRSVDEFRRWRSLDDRRYCRVCHKVISGRQVEVINNTLGSGSLKCPTEGCASSPEDWIYLAQANVTRQHQNVRVSHHGHGYVVSRSSHSAPSPPHRAPGERKEV